MLQIDKNLNKNLFIFNKVSSKTARFSKSFQILCIFYIHIYVYIFLFYFFLKVHLKISLNPKFQNFKVTRWF
jgi:predicted permease